MHGQQNVKIHNPVCSSLLFYACFLSTVAVRIYT